MTADPEIERLRSPADAGKADGGVMCPAVVFLLLGAAELVL